RQFYLIVIPLTIGLMVLHQGGDWLRKLMRARFRASFQVRTGTAGSGGEPRAAAPTGPGEIRMLPFERFQHAVLAISFLTLVWTGFALKYPDQWWARPLLMMEGARSMRSLIHRAAAVVFIAISV